MSIEKILPIVDNDIKTMHVGISLDSTDIISSSCIFKQKDTKILFKPLSGTKARKLYVTDNYSVYHLYVVSSEDLINGDWCFLHNKNILCKFDSSIHKDTIYLKIIASTDKSLNLPLISDVIIDEYIEKYNEGNIIVSGKVQFEEKYDIKSACTCDTFEECFKCPFSIGDKCEKRFEDDTFWKNYNYRNIYIVNDNILSLTI